jgi:formiminotetrahydrofolate cyclodeaminase
MNQAPATSAIRSMSIGDFADALASKAPAPGGGAVAPIVGALAASLGRMVLAYTTGKKKYAEHATLHERSGETLATLGVVAMELADADAEAYGRLNALWGLAEDDERRRREWAGAVDAAIAAPAGVLGTSLSILHHLEPLVGTTNRMLRSDLAIAAALGEVAARAAAWNVRVNLPLLDDAKRVEALEHECDEGIAEARRVAAAIETACGG